MAISVVMPALEMAQETGKLLAWRKKEGESVNKGEILFEIETDKAVMEIESPGDGVLADIKAAPGTDIPVGQTIAWIVLPGEAAPQQTAPAVTGRRTAAETGRGAVPTSPVQPSHAAELRISPKARRLAREHGIELSSLRGSGPDGAILEKDILAAVTAGASASQADTRAATLPASTPSPLTSVARLMAERTTQSWTTVPHFFVVREVYASALMEARAKHAPTVQRQAGVKLSPTDLLLAIIARVLAKHPRINASWSGGTIRQNPQINLALAIAVDDGVVAPVIHNANTTTLAEIARQRHDLAERARSGKLHPQDISGGTFTLSNLGMYNVDAFSAIITPPQAAILAVSRIADRVVPVSGQPAIRPMMTMTLSSDHRVIDGARAALFLNDLSEALVAPQESLD